MTQDFDRDGFLDVAATRSFVDGPVLLFLGNGRGGFAEPLPFATPEYPRSLVTGDFNRDGFPDLAFTFSNRPTIGVLLGGGGGRFGPAVEYPAGPEPWDLVAADFNGDHADDVAVILNGSNGSAGVAILLATGTGAFGGPTTLPDGQSPRDIAAADLNHDGKVDLAIANVNENAVSVLLGNGAGSFGARTTFPVPPNVLAVAVGFFNADSDPDLAVSGGGLLDPAFLAIVPGNGQGGFGAAITVASLSTYELEVLDFNHDGNDDLAGRWNGVTVLIGNGDGGFQSLPPPANGARWGLAPGDFNSDGWVDFAVALQDSLDPRTLLVYFGDASGVVRERSYPGAVQATALTVGDFNHDGRSDVAVADNSLGSYPQGSLAVMLAASDGSLSAPAVHLTVFQPSSILNADFNGDGHLDLACANSQEVSILLGNGTGAFSAATNFPLAPLASAIDTADFNSDNKLDLVFSNYDGVRILLGDGMGGFGPPSTHPVFGPSPVARDFNLDGKADVALLGDHGYRILFGDGAGHFGEPMDVSAGTNVSEFVVADFNGDGRPDVAGAGASFDEGSVVLGLPGGSFGLPLPFPAGITGSVLAVGDFDLDGKPDLAVATGAVVSFLRGNGNGTFARAGHVFIDGGASELAFGRFDSDALPDLIGAGFLHPDVTVLRNTNCLARRLGVTRNPSACSLPSQAFEVQPVAQLFDDGDNLVSCAGGAVQASILPGTGSPGASLQGTTSVGLAAGTATFSNLSVNAAGQGYILQFSRAGVVSTRSREFRVDPGCKGPFQLFTVTPCRVADTRAAPGLWGAPSLSANSTRVFPITGRCGIPITARSVAANLTIVSPTDAGHLTLFPAGYPVPLASTINFRAGIVRANNAILTLGDEGDVGVLCAMPPNPANRVDFLIDVSGYFE